MTRLLISLAVLCMFFSCEENIDDKEELSSFITENYQDDAKQLYFNEIISDSTHSNYNNPILDKDRINEILEILQAVYESNSPERDTVFEIYQIHRLNSYGFSSITLKVQTDLPEIENLANNIFPTGHTELDKILTTYSFDSVKTSYSYPDFPWLTVYTPNEYNLIPVEKEFNELSSVILVEKNIFSIGGGDNISLTRVEGVSTIIFSIGRGDCPAGCIYHKYWEFIVRDGEAEFVRSYEN